MSDNDPIQAAFQLLGDNGYMVFKIPECAMPPGHGRHTLRTRSAMCEGVGPIPHGYHNAYFGSFGPIINCRCGLAFSDYGSKPSQWVKHQQEHGLIEEGK